MVIVFIHVLIRVFFIICSLMLANVIQHRWAVDNFNSYLSCCKPKSKSDSLLGICRLLSKIVYVLIFYILRPIVSGLLTFSNGFLTGKVLRKSDISNQPHPLT